MRRAALLVIAAVLQQVAYAQDEAFWTEHYDPKQNRKYYYNAAAGVTQWDPPQNAKIQYMQGDGQQGDSTQPSGGGSPISILAVALAPLILVVGGLLALYWQATRNGLEDALKNMRGIRDRSQKRRSTKAGGKFKSKFKLSQDGKGGRSANS